MGAGKSLGKPDEMLGVTQGRVVIVIVTLCLCAFVETEISSGCVGQ